MTIFDKIKLGLWSAGILTLLAGAYGLVVYSNAYDRSLVYSAPSISVTGTGKTIAAPDVARFTYTVISQGGKEVAKLKTDNDLKSNAIIAFLKKNNVPVEDIKTVGYDMTPRYQNYDCRNVAVPMMAIGGSVSASSISACPPASIVGYEFRNSVEVTVRDFAKQDLSQLVSGVVNLGATDVSALRFELNDPAAARTLAKAEAIRKAMVEAKNLAQEGGFSLGRLISIDESGNPNVYSQKYSLATDASGGAMMPATAPAISAGSQEISVSVVLRYALGN